MEYTPGGYQQPPENNYSDKNRETSWNTYQNGSDGGYNNSGYDNNGYNNNPQYNNSGYSYNGYPYNHQNGSPNGEYRRFFGKRVPPFIPQEVWLRERRNIRKLSMIAGLGIILYIVLSSAVVGIFQGISVTLKMFFEDSYAKFSAAVSSTEFSYLFQTLYSIFLVGGPFFLLGLIANKKGHGTVGSMPLGKPRYAKYLPVIIIGAFGICLLGNIITSYIDFIIEKIIGMELVMPEMPPTPKTPMGIFLNILSTAAVPALIEEMALRGIVMQPLRRYGDWYAIICSSLIFGLMHCNLVQIPFAFIAGIAIGYAVIVTESLWTGVIIHFCNNAFSVVVSMIYEFYGENSPQYMLCNSIFYIIIVLGVLCAFIYLKKLNHVKMHTSPLINSGKNFIYQPDPFSVKISNKTLFKTYIVTVPMIIAFIAVTYETVVALFLTA